ncbi:hypothetical protein BKA62DRAFT_714319 [Auriculariales sp. MPI-PUGE-AT-0066]|nr:hypothetical protein BKA62DRAFT_714319 [Auriculariales sp. MPI-PUGE-AT-0066]
MDFKITRDNAFNTTLRGIGRTNDTFTVSSRRTYFLFGSRTTVIRRKGLKDPIATIKWYFRYSGFFTMNGQEHGIDTFLSVDRHLSGDRTFSANGIGFKWTPSGDLRSYTLLQERVRTAAQLQRRRFRSGVLTITEDPGELLNTLVVTAILMWALRGYA